MSRFESFLRRVFRRKRRASVPVVLGAPYDFSKPFVAPDSMNPYVDFAEKRSGLWGYAESMKDHEKP
jgi:hypothetical protein